MTHKLALESDLVEADAVEAIEFQELAREYKVFGVPKTVVNCERSFEGAMPEEQFVAQVRRALLGVCR